MARDKKLIDLPKRGKISRKANRSQSKAKLRDEFIRPESSLPDSGGFLARVVEVHKRYSFVSPEPTLGEVHTSEVWVASVARRHLQAFREERNLVAVGDRVWCQEATAVEDDSAAADDRLPSCTMEYRLERTSRVARRDPLLAEREHVLAANISQLVIVSSFRTPRIKWGLIDRYLVLAEDQSIPAIVIINKADLLQKGSEAFQAECKLRIEVYRNLGYRVLVLAAQEVTEGSSELAELEEVFAGKISLVSGHSGVGKSSIINLLKPEIVQEVEEVEVFRKGRHTTTYASMIGLQAGGFVVDSPGIRSFVLDSRPAIELSFGFREIRAAAVSCKYRKCRHVNEVGCAVVDQVAEGKIPEWRYASYKGILLGTTGREGRHSGEDDDD